MSKPKRAAATGSFMESLTRAVGLTSVAISEALGVDASDIDPTHRAETPLSDGALRLMPAFLQIIDEEAQKVSHVKTYEVTGAAVRVEMGAFRGLPSYSFYADFNDYGELTGTYHLRCINYSDPEPRTFAERVKHRLRAITKGGAPVLEARFPKVVRMKPVFVPKIWGGRKLHDDFGYDIPKGQIGECWAISAHPHGDCEIDGGPYAGLHLSELWQNHRELFGNAPGDRFPLLIKILDAQEPLSVQVHPDDAYAAVHEHGSLGKRECWYVLDAPEDGRIVVGQHAHSREEFGRMVDEDRWDELLNYAPIHKGDFFCIEPGTLHAILGGTEVLETQQSSDVTYRVYDFDRTDAEGNKRELHLAQALDCVNYDAKPPTSGEILETEKDGVTPLWENKSFSVMRVRVHEDAPVTLAQHWDYLCMSVTSGSGTLEFADDDKLVGGDRRLELEKGNHLVCLASSGTLRLGGELELVCSYVDRARQGL